MSVWTIILLASLSAGCLMAGRLLIHYFQLESYQHPGYFRTVRRNLLKALLPGFLLTMLNTGMMLVLALVVPVFPYGDGMGTAEILVLIAWVLVLVWGGWLIGRKLSEKKAKKAGRA